MLDHWKYGARGQLCSCGMSQRHKEGALLQHKRAHAWWFVGAQSLCVPHFLWNKADFQPMEQREALKIWPDRSSLLYARVRARYLRAGCLFDRSSLMFCWSCTLISSCSCLLRHPVSLHLVPSCPQTHPTCAVQGCQRTPASPCQR